MHEQRIAVGLRLRDLRGADGAARAGPVLDDDGLAELRGEFFGDRARHDVGAAPGGERDDDPHRLRGPGLRQRAGLYGAQRQCSYRSTQFSGHSFLPSGLPRGSKPREQFSYSLCGPIQNQIITLSLHDAERTPIKIDSHGIDGRREIRPFSSTRRPAAHFELRTGCHEARAGITRTSLMRTRSLEPSASITQISAVPRRLVSNSSFAPSGVQEGLSFDAGAGVLVSCVLLRPSWSMTQIWP